MIFFSLVRILLVREFFFGICSTPTPPLKNLMVRLLLYEYTDLFTDIAVHNSRFEFAIAN